MRPAEALAQMQGTVRGYKLPDDRWHADVRVDDDSDGYRFRVIFYRSSKPDDFVLRVGIVPWRIAMRAPREAAQITVTGLFADVEDAVLFPEPEPTVVQP